jgi:hypothetical protein
VEHFNAMRFATADRHSFYPNFVMKKQNFNHAIVQEMALLLEKTAVESFAPVITDTASDAQNQEAVLINLKAINARYDKHEAIAHVQALMDKYNIQIDELLEKVHH